MDLNRSILAFSEDIYNQKKPLQSMRSSTHDLKEGILIALVGIVGLIRVLDSLSEAGPMITIMLYLMSFLFITIALIGINIIIKR